MDKKIPEYFIEKIENYDAEGILTSTYYCIFYWDVRIKGFFKKKQVKFKHYLQHREYPWDKRGALYTTYFKEESAARALITNFLSKGIEVPIQISTII